jgi:hypothetical protein
MALSIGGVAKMSKYRQHQRHGGMAASSSKCSGAGENAAEKIIESGASIIGGSENESIIENRKWRNIIGAEKRRRASAMAASENQ